MFKKEKEQEIVVTERAYLDADGYLHLVYTNGADVNLGIVKGADGLPGADGKDGKDGINGLNGKDGKDGLNGLNGKDGLDGKDGVNGLPGMPGLNGKNGKDGVDGKDGFNGLDGKDGKDGADGKDGKDGVDGKDGKDGKDTPASKWLSVIDIDVITNQENSNKEIAIIPIDNIATVNVKLLGYSASGLKWFTGERSATFVKTINGIEKVQEDIIKEPSRTSAPNLLKVILSPTVSGCSVIVHGLPDEEVIWKGTISIGSI